MSTFNAGRGSGLFDYVSAFRMSQAVAAAYIELSASNRTLIDDATEMLVEKVGQRKPKGAQFGEASARELLAALGRML